MRIQSKVNSKKRIIIICAVVAVIAAALIGFIYINNRSDDKSSLSDSGINLDPATPEEQVESDEKKTETADNEEKPAEEPGTSKTVSPVIVDASQYDGIIEVRSYISGTIEDGGTCTATFTKGNLTFSRTSKGSKDATTTLCEKMTVPRADFAESGSWSASLKYESSAATGTSEARVFEVK